MSMMIHRAVLRMRAKEVTPMPSPAKEEQPKKEEIVKETAKRQTRKHKS